VLKPKKDCKSCKKTQEWKKYLLWQIFSFMMTEKEREEFYIKYRKCLNCGWYLAEQQEV
jgi:hypothetical protein